MPAGRRARSTRGCSDQRARVRLPLGEHAHSESAHAGRADALDHDAGLRRELGGDGREVLGGEAAVGGSGIEQRAEELVAGDAGGAVEVADHGAVFSAGDADGRRTVGESRGRPVDAGGEHGSAEAVVDVDHADAAGAGVEHREQRRDPAEVGAVADTRGDRDDRDIDEPGDQGRQRALHAGDRDDRACRAQGVRVGEQRCTPATPTSKRRVTRQPITSAQTAASSATGMSAVPPVATTTWPSRGGSARRSTTMTRAASCHTASGATSRIAETLLGHGARGEHDIAVSEEFGSDRRDLLGGLALAEDDLGKAGAQRLDGDRRALEMVPCADPAAISAKGGDASSCAAWSGERAPADTAASRSMRCCWSNASSLGEGWFARTVRARGGARLYLYHDSDGSLTHAQIRVPRTGRDLLGGSAAHAGDRRPRARGVRQHRRGVRGGGARVRPTPASSRSRTRSKARYRRRSTRSRSTRRSRSRPR